MKLQLPASKRWKWAILGTAALLSAALIWYFLAGLGSSPQPNTPSTPVPTRTAKRTIPYNTYISALKSALEEVRRAESAEGEKRQEAAKAAVQTLESVEGNDVTSPSGTGTPAQIDNSALISALKSGDPDLAKIRASLTVLIESLNAVNGQGSSGTDALTKLDKVLEDPAFNYESNLSPLQRLARWLASISRESDPEDTLWRWFMALLAGFATGVVTFMAAERRLPNKWARLFLSSVTGTLGAFLFYFASQHMGAVTYVLFVIGLVVIVIAFALILVGIKRSASAPPPPKKTSDLASVLGMNAAEAGNRASDSAANGDYRAAIRFRCLALLLALDEADMLYFDRASTNREYLFRAPGGLQEKLQPLLNRFDAVWYGGESVTESDWVEYNKEAREVESRAALTAKQAA